MEDPEGEIDYRLPPPDRHNWDKLSQPKVVFKGIDQEDFELGRDNGDPESSVCDTTPTSVSDASSGRNSKPWVAIPTAPAVQMDEGEIWHYTGAPATIGIITERVLWATAIDSLNDSAEYVYGGEILNSVLDQVARSRQVHPLQKEFIRDTVELASEPEQRGRIYVASASLATDSLSQWRAYGGSAPHAVVLDPSLDWTILSTATMEHRAGDLGLSWQKVIYNEDDQKELIRRAMGYLAYLTPIEVPDHVREFNLRLHTAVLIGVLSHLKHPSFAEEAEVRLLVQDPPSPAIRYRSSEYGIVPYVRITTSDRPVRSSHTKPIAPPILGGAVGPFAARETSADAMRSLLRHAGLPDPSVLVSGTTLR